MILISQEMMDSVRTLLETQEMYGQLITDSVNIDRHLFLLYKRVFDLILSTILLIMITPAFILIAVLIKLDSPGPVFFTQQRVGSRRRSVGNHTIWEIRTFKIYKFRSMFWNADETLHRDHIRAYTSGQYEVPVGKGSFKLPEDPRITRVGRILRKASIDEFPQLINVVKGEMSLVGPRPVPIYEFDDYQEWHKERFAALPGMTGLWQVKGRCQVTFDEQIQMDIDYVRRQSLYLDMVILFLTVPAVFSGKGAG